MKIVNFGSLNLDYVYRVPHTVSVGETLASSSFQILLGGKGLNQSVAISRAGAKVLHGGFIGADAKAQDLVTCLIENGVDVSQIQIANEPQGHALIQVNDEGNNCIVIFGGSNQCVSKEYIDGVLTFLNTGDFVVLQNEISNVDYIISRACEKGGVIIFNASPIDDKILTLDYSMINWLIVNEIEGAAISGTEKIEDMIPVLSSKYPSLNIVLTLGEEGSVCYMNGKTYRQAAFKAKTIDTTAAGDTYLGYIVAGLARGDRMQEIMREASAASALAVSVTGAAGSIPTRDAVLNYLKTH